MRVMSNAHLRAQARAAAAKPQVERRVYYLPETLVKQVLRYQLRHGLPSETAAARVLLQEALAGIEQRRRAG